MAISVVDNPAESRFELRLDGKLAGFAAYRRQPGRVVFLHTQVDDAYEGQGLGSQLARAALDAVREDGEEVVARCEFIARFIREHPEYDDLVVHEAGGT